MLAKQKRAERGEPERELHGKQHQVMDTFDKVKVAAAAASDEMQRI